MIQHFVLIKISPETPPEDIEVFFEGLEKLKKIKGVITADYGASEKYPGYKDRSQGYNYILHVVLKDIEALIAYDNDEQHLEIKKYHIEPFLDKSQTNPVLAVDWAGQPATVSRPHLLSWGLISIAVLSTAVIFLNRGNILSKL